MNDYVIFMFFLVAPLLLIYFGKPYHLLQSNSAIDVCIFGKSHLIIDSSLSILVLRPVSDQDSPLGGVGGFPITLIGSRGYRQPPEYIQLSILYDMDHFSHFPISNA